jgi:hypothetical protein
LLPSTSAAQPGARQGRGAAAGISIHAHKKTRHRSGNTGLQVKLAQKSQQPGRALKSFVVMLKQQNRTMNDLYRFTGTTVKGVNVKFVK